MSQPLTQRAKQVGEALLARGFKLVTAESCTGGQLASLMTYWPGSSTWFERGFITYSNAAKTELLAVKPETLAQFGAVSAETARQMAEGALNHSHADISIAITGIAGPDGGSLEKPVGTVWLALARHHFPTTAIVHHFAGNRQEICEQVIEAAFKNLQELIKQ